MEFPKLKLSRSCALSLSNDPSYVMHFAIQKSVKSGDEKSTLFAAAVSGNNEIKLYSQDTFCSKGSLTGHSSTITAIKFDIVHSNIIWSTSLDGTLRYWNTDATDQPGVVISTLENLGYLSMDISADGAILAVGTEKHEDKLDIAQQFVAVEFWDIRKIPENLPKQLAKFDEIHSDDVTKILFHPTNSKIVATGSTDGLIAMLDLTTFDVEDALTQTLNTEVSVSTMGFFGPSNEFLYTLTHIETIQIWKHQEGELLTSLTDVRMKVPKSNPIDYVVDCIYHSKSQRLFMIGGTHRGCLEVMHLNLGTIEPYQTLSGGHSSTIRCIYSQENSLLTGAEDGMVCSWMEMTQKAIAGKNPSKSKAKSKRTKSKSKPYKTKVEKPDVCTVTEEVASVAGLSTVDLNDQT